MNALRRALLTTLAVTLVAPGLASAQDEADASSAGGPPLAFPLALYDRPLTLPAGVLQVSPVFTVTSTARVTPQGNPRHTASELGLSAAYGLTQEVELDFGAAAAGVPFPSALTLPGSLVGVPPAAGGGTVVQLYPSGNFFEKALDVGVTYAAYHERGVDVAPSVLLAGEYGTNESYALELGANARYHLTRALYAVGGQDLLNIFLHPVPAPVFLALNVGLGYQARRDLALEIGTDLANLGLSNQPSQFLFADFIPVDLLGVYAVDSTLDLLVSGAYSHFTVSAIGLNFWDLLVGASFRV